MAMFNHPITLGSKDGSQTRQVIATVSLESNYTVMPSPLLEMLGVDRCASSARRRGKGAFIGRGQDQDQRSRTYYCLCIWESERPTGFGQVHPRRIRPYSG